MVLFGFSISLDITMAFVILLSEDLRMVCRLWTLEGLQLMLVRDLLAGRGHGNRAREVLMHMIQVFIEAVMTVVVMTKGSAMLLGLVDSLEV